MMRWRARNTEIGWGLGRGSVKRRFRISISSYFRPLSLDACALPVHFTPFDKARKVKPLYWIIHVNLPRHSVVI